MRLNKHPKGFTLIEMSVVIAILGLFVGATLKYMTGIPIFIQRFQVRRQMNSESRVLIDTITRLLRGAKPETIVTSTDPTAPSTAPPSHRINFTGNNGLGYEISWSNNPPNTVYMIAGTQVAKTLASNVVGLSFTVDFRDPAVITVSVAMEAAVDKSGKIGSVYRIPAINRIIRAGQTP